jgi:hypothetical protein
MSRNRRHEVQRARARNIEKAIIKFKKGGARPTLRKKPSDLILSIFRKHGLAGEDFYIPTMSNSAQREVQKAKREHWREKYAKGAIKDNNRYQPRGPNKNSLEFSDMTDAQKLAAHDEHFTLLDIKEGLRCAVCSKFFDDPAVSKIEYKSSISNHVVYLHEHCSKSFNEKMRGDEHGS